MSGREAADAGGAAHFRGAEFHHEAAPAEVQARQVEENEAAGLAESCRQFSVALGGYNCGLSVVPLTPDGTVAIAGAEPSRDLAQLLSWWAGSPSLTAGVPVG